MIKNGRNMRPSAFSTGLCVKDFNASDQFHEAPGFTGYSVVSWFE